MGLDVLKRWFGRATIGLGVSAAAGMAAAASGRPAAADLAIGYHQSSWIFGSNDCSWDSRVDPVNLVFVGPEALVGPIISEHAGRIDHGNFSDRGGGTKYFDDHWECEPMDYQAADGWDPRNHFRLNQGDVNGWTDWDSRIEQQGGGYYQGHYVLAPAHFERYVRCGINPFSHAVFPNGDYDFPKGGYNYARDYIVSRWTEVASDGHQMINLVWANNGQVKQQCNGDLVWSDGYVAYVTVESAPPSIESGSCRGYVMFGCW